MTVPLALRPVDRHARCCVRSHLCLTLVVSRRSRAEWTAWPWPWSARPCVTVKRPNSLVTAVCLEATQVRSSMLASAPCPAVKSMSAAAASEAIVRLTFAQRAVATALSSAAGRSAKRRWHAGCSTVRCRPAARLRRPVKMRPVFRLTTQLRCAAIAVEFRGTAAVMPSVAAKESASPFRVHATAKRAACLGAAPLAPAVLKVSGVQSKGAAHLQAAPATRPVQHSFAAKCQSVAFAKPAPATASAPADSAWQARAFEVKASVSNHRRSESSGTRANFRESAGRPVLGATTAADLRASETFAPIQQ